MKKITNQYKESLPIILNREKGTFKTNQKTTISLNKEESIIVRDDEISPEIICLQKKGCLKVEDAIEIIPVSQSLPVEKLTIVATKIPDMAHPILPVAEVVKKETKKEVVKKETKKEITEPQIGVSAPVTESVKKEVQELSQEINNK
jgi:hypothetical protein